jgi:T4 RnlA family RNA ligase
MSHRLNLQVQQYLRGSAAPISETFAALETAYGIKSRVYEDQGVVVLNYDQINSPKTSPMVIECRSLILYLSDYSIASRKFFRFFNLNESPDTLSDFDFSRAKILEKADGSLIGIWYNRHTLTWEISTRSMAFAEGDHVMGGTFRSMVLDAFKFTEEKFQRHCDEHLRVDWTYVFEWVSPDNRIVTPYKTSHMILTAVYENAINNWADPEEFEWIADLFPNTRAVKSFQINVENIEALKESANQLEGLAEGFVVWDPVSDKRQKVKSLKYLALHSIRGDTLIPTRKNLMKIVLSGETDEVKTYFPEWTDRLKSLEDEVNLFKMSANKWLELNNHIADQKEFALQVKDYPSSALIFMARRNKTTPEQEFLKLDINKQLRYFNL